MCEKDLKKCPECDYTLATTLCNHNVALKLGVRSVAAPRHFMGLMGSAMHLGSEVNFNIAQSFFSILMTQTEVRIFEPQFSNDDAPLE